MDELDEWGIVDTASLDPEVNLQIEFLSWLNAHPDASRITEPLFNFVDGLQIDLCGLCWHLRAKNAGADRAGVWKGQRPSFTVDYVERIEREGISSGDYRGECALSWQNRIDSPRVSQDDALDHLVQQSADPKFRSAIRCRGFVCMEAIGVADSFDDVLDALYEFSSWYTLSTIEEPSEQAIDQYYPWSELEYWRNKTIRHLKVQAEDAGQMCSTAREAQQVAARAAASMLKECCATMKPVREGEYCPSEAEMRWAGRFKRWETVREGLVLQWCMVDCNLGRSLCIDCEVEVGELVVEENEKEVASLVGILRDKPLHIRIDLLSESVEVSQERGFRQAIAKSMAADFLLPHLVKNHIFFLDQPTPNNNVFITMLHQVASYLTHLSSICLVCTQPLQTKKKNMDKSASLPLACFHPLCEATFYCWAHASCF